MNCGVNMNFIEMDKYIKESIPELYNIYICQNDTVLMDKYYQRYSYPGYAVNIKSVSKILLALAVGVMLKEGLITGVEQKVSELLPEYEGLMTEDLKKNLMLRHLLTMTSGFEWQEDGKSFFDWLKSSDWVAYALKCPYSEKSGTVFRYNTANAHLISAIIKHRTGENAFTFISKRIFHPLGIQHALWQKAPEGNDYGGSELYLAPRDLTKIGQLILNGGIWNESYLFPEGWIKECLNPQITVNKNLVYGYFCFGKEVRTVTKYEKKVDIMTWFVPGTGGQFLYIIPQLNATVVITSLIMPNDRRDPNTLPSAKLFQKYIIKSLVDQLNNK